jgi:hypothetical protein
MDKVGNWTLLHLTNARPPFGQAINVHCIINDSLHNIEAMTPKMRFTFLENSGGIAHHSPVLGGTDGLRCKFDPNFPSIPFRDWLSALEINCEEEIRRHLSKNPPSFEYELSFSSRIKQIYDANGDEQDELGMWFSLKRHDKVMVFVENANDPSIRAFDFWDQTLIDSLKASPSHAHPASKRTVTVRMRLDYVWFRRGYLNIRRKKTHEPIMIFVSMLWTPLQIFIKQEMKTPI